MITETHTGRGIPAVTPPRARPLVIPVSPRPGESLVGLIARASAANVLRSPEIILREAGLKLGRPGVVGQEACSSLEEIAVQLGCAADELQPLTHPYLHPLSIDEASRKDAWRRPVQWGSGALERRHLDLRVRRISPLALQISHHHRSAWLCTLLPFCPETLELLVGRCDACDQPLGWYRTRGIGRCDHCRAYIQPSAEPPLHENLAIGYRAFADLISIDPAARARAMDQLDPELSALSPTMLVRLIVGLGRALEPSTVDPGRGLGIVTGDRSIAEAISTGMDAVRCWPERLRERLSDVVAHSSVEAREESITRLRSIGAHLPNADEMRSVLRAAVPEAFASRHRALAFQPIQLATETCRKAGINLYDLRRIEEAGGIKGVETLSNGRTFKQYARDDVDELAAAVRGSCPGSMLERQLGIPAYAIGQLVELGQVEAETTAGVRAFDPRLRLTIPSFRAFVDELTSARSPGHRPGDLVSLRTGSRWFGGGLKPWGTALATLRRGGVPFWLGSDAEPASADLLSWQLLVRRADIPNLFAHFEAGAWPPTSPVTPFSQAVSKSDACEILNTGACQLQSVFGSGVLPSSRRPERGFAKAHYVNLSDVLALAGRAVGPGELAMLLAISPYHVVKMLKRHPLVGRDCFGWSREAVAAQWANIVEDVSKLTAGGRKLPANRPSIGESHAKLAFGALKASLSCTR